MHPTTLPDTVYHIGLRGSMKCRAAVMPECSSKGRALNFLTQIGNEFINSSYWVVEERW